MFKIINIATFKLFFFVRLIHEESGTLQNLQQDKEDIERALGGLRHRLSKGFKDPGEIELARKQQIMLENELIRVHFMLAQNSKKVRRNGIWKRQVGARTDGFEAKITTKYSHAKFTTVF